MLTIPKKEQREGMNLPTFDIYLPDIKWAGMASSTYAVLFYFTPLRAVLGALTELAFGTSQPNIHIMFVQVELVGAVLTLPLYLFFRRRSIQQFEIRKLTKVAVVYVASFVATGYAAIMLFLTILLSVGITSF